jgi:UDP-3-O-[3-hydroxymyristoyl] glucosamine N-acyltransferase
LVKISHGVAIGRQSLIISNAYIAGRAKVGDCVYIGPQSTIGHVKIGDGAFITMGSVVVSNVKKGEKVSGNFAIEHSRNMQIIKNNMSNLKNGKS